MTTGSQKKDLIFFFFKLKKKGGVRLLERGGSLIRACSLIRSNTVNATQASKKIDNELCVMSLILINSKGCTTNINKLKA